MPGQTFWAQLEDTGKPLKLQGPTPQKVDSRQAARILYGLGFDVMPHPFTFVAFPMSASEWWWYRTVTEGAARV
jgi:hypothetical protein